jgi:hypothetical protein
MDPMPPVAGPQPTNPRNSSLFITFRAYRTASVQSPPSLSGGFYVSTGPAETTIERIYREVTGRKMRWQSRRFYYPSSVRIRNMEGKGKLNAKEIRDLSDELAALAQKQSDARPTEVYVRMTPQEIKDFDKRKERNFPDLCDSGKQ